jgi:PAS domain S-box-containing protein
MAVPNLERRRRSVLRWLPQLLIFAAVTAAYLLGAFEPIERALMDSRFRLLPRDATGKLVVVEIDAKSLHQLDTWPWPRSYHARLIDTLFAAGADEVELDIDLSATSTPEADEALAAALARQGARVILPMFAQRARTGEQASGLVYTFPAPPFRGLARLGAVNVFPGADSLVRSYAREISYDGARLPSSPVLLADDAAGPEDFYLDFGIRVSSIPRLSYVDVLEGRFDASAIAGKKVIVGATAVELGDQFAVPLHRTLAGPLLQALAYESMTLHRALHRSAMLPTLALALVVLAGGAQPRPSRPWRASLFALLLIITALYAAALLLQAATPLSLDIAPAMLGAAALYGVGALRELERQTLEALKHRLSDLRRRAIMQSVLEDSFDGIIIAGADGSVELINAAGARLLGCTRAEPVGKPIDQFLPGSTALHDRTAGERQAPVEKELTRPDGTTIAVEQVATCSRLPMSRAAEASPATRPDVFIHTFRDISERKSAEAKLREALREADASSRAKSEFLANMSHELRTPLNAIIGFSEIIQKEMFGALSNPRYREYASDIAQSGAHLLGIINDILDVSKIEAGRFALNEERVDLGLVIAKCLKLVKARSPSAEALRIAGEIMPGLPPIRADLRLIKQIVLNLLSNAVKFTPRGGSVTASAALEAERVVLRVADTGIGIPVEELSRVTRPFYQVDSGLTRQREGAGLGLALVASYSRLHGAELSIASVVDEGTVVTLRFPRERLMAGDAAAAMSLTKLSAVGPQPG